MIGCLSYAHLSSMAVKIRSVTNDNFDYHLRMDPKSLDIETVGSLILAWYAKVPYNLHLYFNEETILFPFKMVCQRVGILGPGAGSYIRIIIILCYY